MARGSRASLKVKVKSQLPVSLNTKLSQAGGAGYGGALVMGLVSGLIAAPCTGPVLAVVLALVATTGQIFLGLWLMVALSLGLGMPFLVIAVLSGRRIPTSGLWMDLVKTVLATAMFTVAIYFVQIASPVLHFQRTDALPDGQRRVERDCDREVHCQTGGLAVLRNQYVAATVVDGGGTFAEERSRPPADHSFEACLGRPERTGGLHREANMDHVPGGTGFLPQRHTSDQSSSFLLLLRFGYHPGRYLGGARLRGSLDLYRT